MALRYATLKRWKGLWSGFYLDPRQAAPVWRIIVDRYTEPHRHYHDLRHIDWCYAELDALTEAARNDPSMPEANCAFGIVELSLAGHDIIYVPDSTLNEDLSAHYFTSMLKRAGIYAPTWGRIARCILATAHAQKRPETLEEQVLVDIDLASLGHPPRIFERNTINIRAEFLLRYTAEEWEAGRRKFLRPMLERAEANELYSTPYFKAKYNEQAIKNLRRSIA